MSNKLVIAGIVVLNLLVVGVVSYLFSEWNKTKIGYVRSQELIYSYEGTKEAMTKFNGQKEQWQANVDTLKVDFERAISKYNADYPTLNATSRKEQESRLASQEQQLQTYTQSVAQKIQQEDEKMMQAVLNQVNSFVENYGKQNGYDVILGTTLSGSVLYGDETIDVTEELLEALNQNYRGEGTNE